MIVFSFHYIIANDAVHLSNTLALELHGWTGLCIEPNPGYWYGLSHRNCTVVGAFVGGAMERVKVEFRGEYSGIAGNRLTKKQLIRMKQGIIEPGDQRYTVPMEQILRKFQVPKVIDYLSLDVEGSEWLIMQNFPFEGYRVRIMTVERPPKRLRELLESKGYVFLKNLGTFGETLWAHRSMGLTPDNPKITKYNRA